MTPTQVLKRTRPFVFDSVVRYGARAAKRAAPLDKQLGAALNLSRPRATCLRNGDENSVFAHVLATFRALAEGEHTTPMPLLLEAWNQIMAVIVAELTNDELRALHAELTDREHDDEAVETRATTTLRDDSPADEWEAAADVEMREIETQMLRVAVRREIALRKRAGRWS